MNIDQFIRNNPPKEMPFRPGSPYTQFFGLRSTAIGSPIHLGVDRGREPRTILMPFDGKWIWNNIGGDWGSILRIIPEDGTKLEIQIAHTTQITNLTEGKAKKGSVLPIQADEIGLSAGIHTHTEVLIPMTPGNYEWALDRAGCPLYSRTKGFLEPYIEQHCKTNGLDYIDVRNRAMDQVGRWSIASVYEHVAVRTALPNHRLPHWGSGAVILLDSKEFLQI